MGSLLPSQVLCANRSCQPVRMTVWRVCVPRCGLYLRVQSRRTLQSDREAPIMMTTSSPWNGSGGARADSFLLVLERFTSPMWLKWDPDLGCSDPQAVAAVEALARLHATFAEGPKLASFSWTPLKEENQGHFQGTWLSPC
mmetsp:Transcript_91438/g.212662  ORF Transcript_91438/g.212662 Transcript_91438/m.212662 type:complete len:141 (+) Transcript_91438:116-538(+)